MVMQQLVPLVKEYWSLQHHNNLNPNTITGKIYLKIFELLEAKPDGIRWKDLQLLIEKSYPEFHPKTINGCIWQLTNKFPDKVIKPSRGLFILSKPK